MDPASEASTPPSFTAPETAPGERRSSGIKETRAPIPPQDGDMENHDAGKPPQKPKKKREKNPKFKDVEETGKWGELSTTEIYIAIGVVLVIVVGLGAGLGVAFSKDPGETVTVPAPTRSPTSAPTLITSTSELKLIEIAVDSKEVTAGLLEGMPDTVEAYEGLNVEGNSPEERAMSWLLFEDTRPPSSEEVVLRWVFASIFYGMGGEDWTSAENWLSDEDVCDWEFVDCDPQTGSIREIDLAENNLTGVIPKEIALIETLTAFTLRGNQVEGQIPGDVFGSLPRLTILNLDGNLLTGTLPLELTNNGVLNSLYVQENLLTGNWPQKFCPHIGPIENFGLDCDKVTCNQCCSAWNCYFEV